MNFVHLSCSSTVEFLNFKRRTETSCHLNPRKVFNLLNLFWRCNWERPVDCSRGTFCRFPLRVWSAASFPPLFFLYFFFEGTQKNVFYLSLSSRYSRLLRKKFLRTNGTLLSAYVKSKPLSLTFSWIASPIRLTIKFYIMSKLLKIIWK